MTLILGHTERLTIKEHQYGPYRHPPLAAIIAARAKSTPADVCQSTAAKVDPLNASDERAMLKPQVTAANPPSPNIPPASPDCDSQSVLSDASVTLSDGQFSTFPNSEYSPTSPTLNTDVFPFETISIPKGLPGVIAAIANPVSTVSVKQVVCADAQLVKPQKILSLKEPVTPESVLLAKEEVDLQWAVKEEIDDLNGEERDDIHDVFDSTSQYDTLSLVNTNNGRIGNSLSAKIRVRARKGLLAIFQRPARDIEA